MDKTASQIGDIVLEKLAVSPGLARKVLESTVRRIPSAVKGKRIAPYDMYLSRRVSAPRTMGRAAKTVDVPVPRREKKDLLDKQLTEILNESTPGGVAGTVLPLK